MAMAYTPRPKPDPRPCGGCGSTFQPRSQTHRYCSPKCKERVRHRPSQVGSYSPARYQALRLDPVQLEARRVADRATRRSCREWLAAYKTERGCIDCGFNKHSAALQLDHEGPKRASISDLRSSVKRMLDEIERGRCVVRCANCHAMKTWAEKNGVAYVPERDAWVES